MPQMFPAWITQLLVIGLAGSMGALSRWGIASWIQTLHPAKHYGTLAANILGCLLFGLVWQLFDTRVAAESHLRDFFLIGFLGSFTTFSTFAHDTHQLHTGTGLFWALVNITVSVFVGWGALIVGISMGKLFG